jgi:hypothetical protein
LGEGGALDVAGSFEFEESKAEMALASAEKRVLFGQF